jgi:hypothetical protein
VDIANQNELLITGHIIIMYFYEVFFFIDIIQGIIDHGCTETHYT